MHLHGSRISIQSNLLSFVVITAVAVAVDASYFISVYINFISIKNKECDCAHIIEFDIKISLLILQL